MRTQGGRGSFESPWPVNPCSRSLPWQPTRGCAASRVRWRLRMHAGHVSDKPEHASAGDSTPQVRLKPRGAVAERAEYWMKSIGSAVFAVSIFASPATLGSARAHDWYPRECCHEMDCAPVESILRLVPTGGGAPQLVVTSKHGRAIVRQDFPIRESKDGRMHVCMKRYDALGEMEVNCLFMPPTM
jgi:hypothetical protein